MKEKKQFLDKLKEAIEQKALISPEDRVLVALSGGADSVALLCGLRDLGYDVRAYHLNHGLRGSEADGDQAYCEALCREMGVEFFTETVDVTSRAQEENISFEDAGRKTRYEGLLGAVLRMEKEMRMFREERESPEIVVVTGHHSGDVAETFMINAMRGAGLAGLCSISEISMRAVERSASKFAEAGKRTLRVVRPLLDFKKRELEEFLVSRGTKWKEDSSNQSDAYLRNRVRKILDPTSIQKIIDCISLLREDRDFIEAYIDTLAEAHISRIKEEDGYLLHHVETLHRAEYSRLVRRVFKLLVGDLVDLGSKNVEAVMRLDHVGRRVLIGSGTRKVEVYRSYEGLEFRRVSLPDPGEGSEKNCPDDCGGKSESEEGRRKFLLSEQPAYHEIRRKNEYRWVTPEDERVRKIHGVRVCKGLSKRRATELRSLFSQKEGKREHLILIDGSKVKGELRVRGRMEGDFLHPLGLRGRKTVKKLMIDEKIDQRLRADIPIVVDDEKIIWVAGIKMSDLVRTDFRTKDFWALELFK